MGALIFFPNTANSADIIILTAAGDAYHGAPKFRVFADDKIIGAGEISNSVDTVAGSSVESLNGKLENNIARFVFTVPSLSDVKAFNIEFYNDLWAGEGKTGDRNLYILGVSLSMVQVTSNGPLVRTVDLGPKSFAEQPGVKITEQWAMRTSNGRLDLERPVGGWLPEAMTSSAPEKKGITGILSRLQKKKAANSAPPAKKQVSAKPKASDGHPETKGAITGSLPPAKKKKETDNAPVGKSKPSAAAAPAETENPAPEPEGQVKPPNYSRYALPKEKCRRIGEKGTDRLC